MRRRSVVAGLSVLVAVLVVTLVIRGRRRPKPPVASPATVQQSNAPPATAPPIHGQQQLVTQILQQGLTPERAKLLFSMVVGPLPGVTVPPGSRSPADWDGTLAVSYLGKVWDSLTPEQRTAAAALIHRSGTAGGQRSSSAASRPMVVPVAYVPTVNAPAFDYQGLADTANIVLSGFLGKPPVPFDINPDYGPAPGTEYAHTTSWIKPEDLVLQTCHILVWDQKFTPLSYTDAKAVVTHEMVHCYQQRETGSPQASMSVHPWISEGEATWAMQVVVPAASDAIMDTCWTPYINQPTAHFANRSYDAVGVYAHQADLAGDAAVWPKLLPMVTMAMGGGQSDIDAFNFLTSGDQITYFTDWGSSYFEVEKKTPWDMLNRYPASRGGPSPDPVPVNDGTEEMLSPAANYESKLFQLTKGSADVVIVALLTGYGRLHDEAFTVDEALDVSAPLALCLKQGGCKCPDGSPGASLFTKPAAAPLAIGINGGSTTAQVGVAGMSLDKFCKQPDPPTPPAPPGPGGGGGGSGGAPISGDTPPEPPQGESRGDTHVVTIDGLHYNFQVIGEYTLVKSTKDDFLVQVRAVPVRNSSSVSMNQAIATKLGGHRVTVSIENGTQVLRVDGKDMFGTPLPAPLRGAVLCTDTVYGSSCQLTWPDGTIVRAVQIERFALNVAVQPARSRLGTLVGLLGDGNGSPANDLVGTGGAQLGTDPSEEAINHSLASAWRVRPGASLFDYLPGQSSKTFADTTFPRARADARLIASRDSAEKVCRQEGITDAKLLDDCIVDFAVTNNFAYASVYSHAQRVTDARAALRSTSMGGVLGTMSLDGTITDKSQQPVFTFAAKDSDVIWIDSAGCQDANGTIRLEALWHPPGDNDSTWDGKMDQLIGLEPRLNGIDRVGACRVGRIKLMGGTIGLQANPFKDALGAFHIPVHLVRHDRVRAITYGTTVDGDIENPAVSDIYTFIGHPGDVVRISGEGCDIGRMITAIMVPSGYATQGPSCSGGDYTLPPNAAHAANDTTFQLIVNWMKVAGPSKYHFVLRAQTSK